MVDAVLADLEVVLPPVLYRNHPRFKEWVGVSPRTMSNLDVKGLGPEERITTGKVTGYPRASVIEWLRERMKPIERKRPLGAGDGE